MKGVTQSRSVHDARNQGVDVGGFESVSGIVFIILFVHIYNILENTKINVGYNTIIGSYTFDHKHFHIKIVSLTTGRKEINLNTHRKIKFYS